ncbi:hypothetical protein KNT87_gp236 [Erwinia phage Cronus]|uniref:Uncharacterized protein n=1 Tax=Erwinia phage Cronus TaxID=2163633 RepID=A0A2S1GLW6_9CAUD|nr:hypothetical protein KNT87_gp236 [Erwinia phage Cronus]AWD90333.1 hypothetical protein [Erwinia phage Cronus]
MPTKITDNRKKLQTTFAHQLLKGAKFDFNNNIFMVTGSKGDLVHCVHLTTGETHYIKDEEKVEVVSVEIIVEAL